MPVITDSPVAYARDGTNGAVPTTAAFATESDAIVAAMSPFIEGGRAGRSAIMRPSFLPDATIWCAWSSSPGPESSPLPGPTCRTCSRW